jgi:hypothetical protein
MNRTAKLIAIGVAATLCSACYPLARTNAKIHDGVTFRTSSDITIVRSNEGERDKEAFPWGQFDLELGWRNEDNAGFAIAGKYRLGSAALDAYVELPSRHPLYYGVGAEALWIADESRDSSETEYQFAGPGMYAAATYYFSEKGFATLTPSVHANLNLDGWMAKSVQLAVGRETGNGAFLGYFRFERHSEHSPAAFDSDGSLMTVGIAWELLPGGNSRPRQPTVEAPKDYEEHAPTRLSRPEAEPDPDEQTRLRRIRRACAKYASEWRRAAREKQGQAFRAMPVECQHLFRPRNDAFETDEETEPRKRAREPDGGGRLSRPCRAGRSCDDGLVCHPATKRCVPAQQDAPREPPREKEQSPDSSRHVP